MKLYIPWILTAFLAFYPSPTQAQEAQTGPSRLLINGTIVAADRVIPNGWVAVQDGKILSVSTAKPNLPGAHSLITRDIVFPGFVDLHNHPLYAVFPRWKPPQVYANRYEWRAYPGYLNAIQTPEGKLVATHFCDMNTYVEVKALAGGTSSLLGIYSPADTPSVQSCVAGLVRNLDWASGLYGTTTGQERAGNVLGVKPGDLKLSADVLELHRQNKLDLIAVHLAEGQRTDPASQNEFGQLEALKLLSNKTTVVHGIALGDDEFGKLQTAGASFIWSPRSNFELYGQTADISAALRQRVTMALAPDWSPTGSTNMLAEIAYAKMVSDRDFAGALSAKQLFEMATIVPARIARIDDKVGSLAPGLYADLFLLRGDTADVFAALAGAAPQDVTLAMVAGVPMYGEPDYLTALGTAMPEVVEICGTERALNRQVVAGGSFAAVTARLAAALAEEKIQLAGLTECR